MKIESIKRYLRGQTIAGRRSTWANAFASALAPFDAYSKEAVAEAIGDLGQNPDGDLECVYCGQPAATWDHLYNRVIKGEFSGHGHRVRNLVPCCRTCNERKGAKSWRDWLETLQPSDLHERMLRIERFLGGSRGSRVGDILIRDVAGREFARFLEIRQQVFELIREADVLAATIRAKVSAAEAGAIDE